METEENQQFGDNNFQCPGIKNFENVEEFSVTNLDIFWTVISIIMRASTIIINIILAAEYYQKDEINYFTWTAVCIIIPMIVTTLLSIYMYIQDRGKPHKRRHNFCGVLFFIIVLPFIFRYCQSLAYAIASKVAQKKGDLENQKKYLKNMIKEESDVALIRIFECFLESAPQKVLQLSIILREGHSFTWIQFAAISGSVCSLAWCMVVYHKYNRYSQIDKEQISLYGVVGQCCWHFSIAVSRVLCMSLIASIFPMWTLITFSSRILLTSFILMTFDKPKFCSTTIFHSLAFCLILGTVYIFTYIIPKEGRTRYRFSIYYVVCVIENTTCIVLSIIYAKSSLKFSTFFIPLCIFSIAMYFAGIIFMILYYTSCHPNLKTRSPHLVKTLCLSK